MNRRFRVSLLAALLALPLLVAAKTDDQRAAEKRATMYQLLQSIRVLLPLSASPDSLGDRANQQAVATAAASLAKNTTALAAHVKTEEPGARFLGRSVAREARTLQVDLKRKRWRNAAFTLHEMTRYCVACHSRLPSDSSPLASGFIESGDLAKLPAPERARMMLATRQFDPAMTVYESWFTSPLVHPAKMISSLSDYLTTSIRVRDDLKRPIATLKKLKKRKDAWTHLRADIDVWSKALDHYASKPVAPTLTAARAVLDEGAGLQRYPADRRALVHFILASSSLHRFLEKEPTGPRAAEAYLLLSRAESRVEEGYWLDRTEAYLESCIREAPNTSLSEECHAALEDHLMRAYAGTGVLGLPPEVEQELRSLWPEARNTR
jgi:hypothetical protein